MTVKEDEYLAANIKNYVNTALYKYTPRFTGFLDERQQSLALRTVQSLGHTGYRLYGGAENCRRVMLGIFPEGEECPFPIVALRVKYSAAAGLKHGDLLGALMGLQIERDCIGDIVHAEDVATVFVKDDIEEFICQNLTTAGRAHVTVSVLEEEIEAISQEFSDQSGTVASLRLDCIVALVTGKSRTTAVELITARRVFLNQLETDEPAKRVQAGDVLVVRGYGKFIIDDDISLTKRNRFRVTVKKFI